MIVLPLENRDGKTILRVRLTPKAARNGLAGLVVDAAGSTSLKVMVTAAPEKGKANAALVKLLSKQWRLPRSAFKIISGETDRNKTLLIDAPFGDIAGLLAPLCNE